MGAHQLRVFNSYDREQPLCTHTHKPTVLRYIIQFTAAHWASKEKNRGINQLGRISNDQFKYNATKHQEEAWLHTSGSNYTLDVKGML